MKCHPAFTTQNPVNECANKPRETSAKSKGEHLIALTLSLQLSKRSRVPKHEVTTITRSQ